MISSLLQQLALTFGRPKNAKDARGQAILRTKGIALAFGLILSGVGVRGAALCMSPHEKVVDANDLQRWGRVRLTAPRGDILDRDGRALATTVVTPSIVIDPASIDDDERATVAADLAEILGRDIESVLAQLEQPTRYARLGRDVHPTVADAIRRYPHRAVWVERTRKRFYPEENLAAQILGFVDADGNGRSGLESSLNDELAGGTVILQRRRDRRGRGVDASEFDPDTSAGHIVSTTIDRDIQRAAERALAHVVERSAPKSATAVVIDVQTGDILALANAPVFNPNAVSRNPQSRRNHAVQDWFEPGSVMKPFTIAAAVEAGAVTEDSMVNCEAGYWRTGGSRIRDDHPKGIITVTQVMKYSSNIGSAKLALELGPEAFIDSLRAFGFGQRTGVPLPGELAGQIRHPDRIRTIELANTAFGQGMTATAMQLAMGIAAIANDGVLMKPRLITAVTDNDGLPEWTQEPTEVRQAVSPDTAAQVSRMMQAVMEEGGTGRAGRIAGYRVAAKTGTAQKAHQGGYGEARVSSFVGFLPAEAPEVAIVVMVDEPSKGSRYGGTVAGPAFSELGAATMRALGIAPDLELLDDSVEEPIDVAAVADLDGISMEWAGEGWRVPDLSGYALRDVLVGVQGAGLSLELDGSGHVVSQVPAAGTIIEPGQSVSVVLR